MSYSSQPGAVGFKTQAVKGTYLTPGTGGIFAKVRSGGLGTNRDLLIPDPEIGGSRDTADAYLGAVSWGGDIEFYARVDMLATLMKAAFGTAASNTVTGITTHTITPSDGATLPYLSIEEKIGAGLEVYNYTDGVVNTFHLEADANGYLMGTAGIISAKQIAGATASPTPVWDSHSMFVGTNIVVTYNSISLPAKSFSFDLNNNFEDDDFRLGSLYLGDLVPKSREVTCGFTIRPSDSALWRQASYGSSVATQAGGTTVKQQLVITISSYDFIAGGTPANTPYSISLTIPNAIIAPHSLAMSGDDIIETDIEMRAVRPLIATPIVTAAIKSETATIS